MSAGPGRARDLQCYAIGALLVASGTLHFKNPAIYTQIVPPYLPAPKTLVAISGAFEILGGIGLFPRATRRAAAYGLLALLIAVFPANVYMATDAKRFASLVPAWLLWARLPMQPLFMWWIYAAAIRPERDPT